MVSSTYADLKDHREAARTAIERLRYRAEVMEYDGARSDLDIIGSSLGFVADAAAYVCIIGRRYGQTPICPRRNPLGLSVTELEYDEAVRLGRPILVFLVSDRHELKGESAVELDPDKRVKLDAFRKKARSAGEDDSEVERVCGYFDSLDQFGKDVAVAVARLVALLDAPLAPPEPPRIAGPATFPLPPAMVAVPRYIGSHRFIGRAAELGTLNGWCVAANPNPVLMFEAMGGSGKSMLSWQWATHDATTAREDWAGRFWYSFYERGAVMADFCRHALAYVTGRDVADFAKEPAARVSAQLLVELDRRPWLLVLDGLERILVAYHRYDAAQLADADVDEAQDQIGTRNPCAAIRPDDDDLLRRLATVERSKILISSRLTPLALTNRSGRRVPGVLPILLPGLSPEDAEAMIRDSGVFGRSATIRAYLQSNCDCHPLVIGALAGLINDYPPARGNFDGWVDDPRHGAALDLAKLDLVQRRSHILLAAIDALDEMALQLLRTLSLLQQGADYAMLEALNPHLPPPPDEVSDPGPLEKWFNWRFASDADDRADAEANHGAAVERRTFYLQALTLWQARSDVRAAPTLLAATLRDLVRRGLLQYDANGQRYDLHPVVRGVVAGHAGSSERSRLDEKLIDYFNRQPHAPWEDAEALDDLLPGMEIVRANLRMQRFDAAIEAISNGLRRALVRNLGAMAELQALLRPFFPDGWHRPHVPLRHLSNNLITYASETLRLTDPARAKAMLEELVRSSLDQENEDHVLDALRNLAIVADDANRPALHNRLLASALAFAEANRNSDYQFNLWLALYEDAIDRGDWPAADDLWTSLETTPISENRGLYRSGELEAARLLDTMIRGTLVEADIALAEARARESRSYSLVRDLHSLRGTWHFDRGEFAQAVTSFGEAVRMSREAGDPTIGLEADLALARLRAGEIFNAGEIAHDLADAAQDRDALSCGKLCEAVGAVERAIELASRAHRWAIADGEPFVRRQALDHSAALLRKLGRDPVPVPAYDPASQLPAAWEAGVAAFADRLRAARAGDARLTD